MKRSGFSIVLASVAIYLLVGCGGRLGSPQNVNNNVDLRFDYVLTVDLSDVQGQTISFVTESSGAVELENSVRVGIEDTTGELYTSINIEDVNIALDEIGDWTIAGYINEESQLFRVDGIEFPNRSFIGVKLSNNSLSETLEQSRIPTLDDVSELVTCGWERVTIYRVDDDSTSEPEIAWSWAASESDGLPENVVTYFSKIDECKPLANGGLILITSSSGGIGLLERLTGRLLYFGYAWQAHSAELLPDNKIAVAVAKDDTNGSKLLTFDFNQTGLPLVELELSDAHGLYWDVSGQYLWALGGDVLRYYRLIDWASAEPSLLEWGTVELPSSGGHDLYPVAGNDLNIYVTTNTNVWLFDRINKTISEHPTLSSAQKVKGISSDLNGRTAFVEAEDGEWWSARVNLENPSQTIDTEEYRYYKTRWILQAE